MGRKLREHDQRQRQKRSSSYRLLASIGLILFLLGLASWGVPLLTTKNTRSTVPTLLASQGGLGGGGGCFNMSTQKPLIFTVIKGQTAPVQGTVTITNDCQPGQIVAWTGNIASSPSSNWLSISPTHGNSSNGQQSITVNIASNRLSEGVSTGFITLSTKSDGSDDFPVVVNVIRDQQHAELKDIVAYTRISDLTMIAEYPPLIKDQSANLTLSILAHKDLPKNLPAAHQPLINAVLNSLSNETPDPMTDNVLLENAYGPEIKGLVARLDGAAFDISPTNLPPQDPHQHMVNFHWNILPKESGEQNLEVDIAGQWGTQGDKQIKTVDLLSSGFAVHVGERSGSFLALGQLDLSTLLLTLIGSVLNIPWMVEYIQKRREEKKKSLVALAASTPAPILAGAPATPINPAKTKKAATGQKRGRKKRREEP
jgi:hypothetical protein